MHNAPSSTPESADYHADTPPKPDVVVHTDHVQQQTRQRLTKPFRRMPHTNPWDEAEAVEAIIMSWAAPQA